MRGADGIWGPENGPVSEEARALGKGGGGFDPSEGLVSDALKNY